MRHRIISGIVSFFLLPVALLLMLVQPALAAPQVALTPNSGSRGSEITLTGTNFASYIGDVVHILLGSIEVVGSPLIVPENGAFEVTFNVPTEAPSGITYVSVTDDYGIQLGKSNPFKVIASQITLEPESGSVGTLLEINAQGLYASGKVTFYYSSNKAELNMGAEVASPMGECFYSFEIPESVAGEHLILARDFSDIEVEASFEVIPSLRLEPQSVPTGEKLTVNGIGFGYKTDVQIYLDEAQMAEVQTNEYGSFELTFNIPYLKPSSYEIRVEDEDDNTAQSTLEVTPGINLSKGIGHVGEEIVVFGRGFTAGEEITISYDSEQIAEGAADAGGIFSISFDVPKSKFGNHEVTASDGLSQVTSLFYVESDAPEAPELVSPTELGKAKADAYFDWESVTDPSGVGYILEVASDADFTSVILEKTGLTSSDYEMSKDEKLRSTTDDAPYYWRVKAVDSASNESQWSEVGSFYVGFSFKMPAWLIYTLIGIAAVIVAFIAFRLGRRVAYYERDT